MDDLKGILDDVYNDAMLADKKKVKILEIGTGMGNNSTRVLFEFFVGKKKDMELVSYEGDTKYYNSASFLWRNIPNVTIVNEYFTEKAAINTLLIPNIPSYIKDYDEPGDRLKEKYRKLNEIENYFTETTLVPDVVFIDCSRFMHLPIIDMCHKQFAKNPECVYIIEDDYFVDGVYGELEYIEKYFRLKNVKKYSKDSWQWPFVTFQLEGKL